MSTYIQTKAGETVVQTAIRLPVSLRDELKIKANECGQSLNTFIVRSLSGQNEEAAQK